MNNTSFYSALRISVLRILSSLRDSKAWARLHPHQSDTAGFAEESQWKHVDAADAFEVPFDTIRVVTAGHLDPVEIVCVLGCLGYALQANLAGDEVGMPAVSFELVRGCITKTVLEMSYDCTKSIRTEPDPKLAFELARQYIVEGTPCRKTGRSGPVGSRLMEGIGARSVEFSVR